MKESFLKDLSEFYKVFGDTTRLKILEVLLKKEMSVTDISDKLNISQSAISHQLRMLRNLNLVKTKKIGQSVLYSISDNHVKVILEYGIEHIKEKEVYHED